MSKSFIFTWVLSTLLTWARSQSPSKMSPGIFYEEETGQILYEATAPIIYQFKVPEWNDFISLDLVANCQNLPNYTEYCQTFDIFQSISKSIQSAVTPSAFGSFPQQTSQSTWGLKCNYLSQHFSSLRVDVSVATKYMNFLRQCSKGVILEEELNSDYASLPNKDYFENIRNLFESNYLQGAESLKNATALNQYETLLGTGFSAFMAEAIRWNSAISTCKAGLIPDSLVTPEMFLDSLKKLDVISSTSGWIFSVQPEAGFLPLHFKNPLADCTFSDDKFLVRVLVPVRKSNRQWVHLTAQTIPFYLKSYKAFITTQDPYAFDRAFDGQESFFYESVSKRLFKSRNCDTGRPGFCRLPEFWDRATVTFGSCIWSVIQANGSEGPLEYCSSLESRTKDSVMILPLVAKRGTDVYYVAGLPEMNLEVECTEFNGTVSKQEFAFPQEHGTLEVRLPCYCTIITSDAEYEAEAPCQLLTENLSVIEVWHQSQQA